MVAQNSIFPSVKDISQILITFVLVAFGWILFRANSIADFGGYVNSIFLNVHLNSRIEGRNALFFIAVLLIVEWINRKKEHAFVFRFLNVYIRWSIYMITALLCLTQAGKQVQFIYFQF